ncbi:MAG: hypothetical protein ACI8XB_000703 [Patiriisocius sp.]|jgi:hypothetical protein
MKHSIILFTLTLLCGSVLAQENNVIWLSHTLEQVKQKKSTYKMVVQPNGAIYSVNTFDKENNVFMKAESMDAWGSELQGEAIYYYGNGNVQSKGVYMKGEKVGIWKRFSTDGQEKAERIYAIYDAQKRAYAYVDQMPVFNGGQENFDDFLKLSLENVVSDVAGKGQRLVFSFIINESGHLENPEINESASADIDKAIMDVLTVMPRWTAGKKQGENVRVYLEKEIYCQ